MPELLTSVRSSEERFPPCAAVCVGVVASATWSPVYARLDAWLSLGMCLLRYHVFGASDPSRRLARPLIPRAHILQRAARHLRREIAGAQQTARQRWQAVALGDVRARTRPQIPAQI